MSKSNIKSKLYSTCVQLIEEKIAMLRAEIASAREAAAQETKSSAGDKYETGRALIQQEIDKYMKQLEEVAKQKKLLEEIDPTKKSTEVNLGSVVELSQTNYYIAVSIGKVQVDGQSFFALSLASPIGNQLRGLKKGDSFIFNNKNVKIIDIY